MNRKTKESKGQRKERETFDRKIGESVKGKRQRMDNRMPQSAPTILYI